MRLHYLLLFSLGFLLSCKPDPKTPNWDVEALAPIAKSRLDIRDIVADSSLKVDENGLLSLVYQNKLATLQPDKIFEPLNADYQNTIKLNSIDFGPRVLKNSISLGQMSSDGSAQGQFVIFNNGKMAIVPAFPPIYHKKFPIDVTNLFQTITLLTGTATLELRNELPVPLTDVNFLLENKNAQTPVIKKQLDTLKAGETYTEVFSLANLTIEGNLNAELERFDCPGSNGQQVLIDTSDKILVTITLTNLQPSSATAVFPSQDLANDTTLTTIETGNAELTRIKVDNGRIFLDANSTIEDEISLDYQIPNATKNNNFLAFSESIDPAPPNATSSKFTEVDISGYEVDLTGKPGDIDVYNTFYTILLGRIDSSGRLVSLSLDDSVFLETGIRDLTANEGYGYLGQDTIEGTDTSEVDVFRPISQGIFDLDDVRMSLSIENSIGAPIDVRLNELRAQGGSGAVALNWSSLGQNQTVPAGVLNSNQFPIPGRLDLDINKTNSNLDKLVENKPEQFYSTFSAYINATSSSPDYNQFIFTKYGLDVLLNLEIPLNFSASNILLADTNEFDYSTLDPKNQLQHGELKLVAENMFPVECGVDLIMLNERGEALDTLVSADKIQSAQVDGSGIATVATKSNALYPLDKDAVSLLRKTKYLVFQVTLNTPIAAQKVKLYESNYLDLQLVGDLTIRNK